MLYLQATDHGRNADYSASPVQIPVSTANALASDQKEYDDLLWDITEGTSGGNTVRTGKAAEFYDLATGLGSLKVDAFAEYLKVHPTGS